MIGIAAGYDRFDKPLADFAVRLADAWAARTSHDAAGWAPERPSYGQCAVSALVIQDIFGGELMRGEFDGGSHYWNRLCNGFEIDLTRSQFDRVPDFRDIAVQSRSYVLSYPATVVRYSLLRARVRETPSRLMPAS
jgi:hypothetical protein